MYAPVQVTLACLKALLQGCGSKDALADWLELLSCWATLGLACGQMKGFFRGRWFKLRPQPPAKCRALEKLSLHDILGPFRSMDRANVDGSNHLLWPLLDRPNDRLEQDGKVIFA